MADEVLTSTRSERSSHSAGREISSEIVKFQSVLPSPAKGESFHSVYDLTVLDETSQAVANSTWVHRMPSSHIIVDSFLVVRVNAPSAGTTAERVGLNCVKRVVVRNGSTVQEFEYRPVMAAILARSTPAQRQQLLAAAGGASAVAQTVMVPLPVFWSPTYTGGLSRNNVGLPAFMLTAPVELEITMAPQADLLAAGGTFAANGYDSVRVVHIQRKSHADVYASIRTTPWEVTGYDYQTTSGVPYTLASGAQSTIDVSQFDGSSAGIFLNPVTDTSFTANDYYAFATGLSQWTTLLNGAEYMRLTTQIDPSDPEPILQYLSYVYGGTKGIDAGDPTFAHRCKLVPFGGSLEGPGDEDNGDDNIVRFEGFANLRDFTQIDIRLDNTNSDPLRTSVTNVRYAKYLIKDGHLYRRK